VRLSQNQEWQLATDRTPFDNAAERAAWMDVWCARCRHDTQQSCPLATIALAGWTPASWQPRDQPSDSFGRYRCTEWKPRGS
jgi:hypothetical protein